MLLIAGGEADPHVGSLVARMRARGIDGHALLVGAGTPPRLSWDLADGRLRVDGRELRPAALFLRYDAYGARAEGTAEAAERALAWYETLRGWALAHPEVRLPNRHADPQVNKPYVLALARRAGLRVPSTRLTNEIDAAAGDAAGAPAIVKAVNGGGFTRTLDELLASTPRRDGKTAAPAFVQARLEPPEVRVYAVGGARGRRFEAFRIVSGALDYRAEDGTPVEHLPAGVDDGVREGLGRVMDALGLTWGAADFKTDPATGRLAFLEVNSHPAFDAFDAAGGHAVSDALLDHLADIG